MLWIILTKKVRKITVENTLLDFKLQKITCTSSLKTTASRFQIRQIQRIIIYDTARLTRSTLLNPDNYLDGHRCSCICTTQMCATLNSGMKRSFFDWLKALLVILKIIYLTPLYLLPSCNYIRILLI
uniref:Uncharacterized protein n=1 Tax=Glossina brevipalpis TaxID=37001 RepID=A0A1A9WHF1_9MUSC